MDVGSRGGAPEAWYHSTQLIWTWASRCLELILKMSMGDRESPSALVPQRRRSAARAWPAAPRRLAFDHRSTGIPFVVADGL